MRLGARTSRTGARARRHTWPGMTGQGAAIATIFFTAFALGACGGGDSDDSVNGAGNGTPGTNGSATATSVSGDPAELGDEVAQLYFDALDDLEALLGRGLSAASLQPEVESLKEQYIARFVPYGHMREAMSETDRETFDTRVQRAISLSTPGALDVISTARAGLISDGATELADDIMSFNIITQYAFFELLNAQEPEEAQRLGIP